MNSAAQKSTSATPQRPLRTDFTVRAVQQAATAKRRATKKQQLLLLTRNITNMKSLNFMRTVPGAALALAVVASGSVGVYALTNWFGGDVTITQKNPSVFNIDLSACKGPLPAGIDSSTDRRNVQFKILGSPHISAQNLQQELLGECENTAIHEFYASKFPEAKFNSTGATGAVDASHQYALIPATVVTSGNGTISLRYTLGKGAAEQKTLNLASNVSVYDASQASSLAHVRAGDKVMFVAYSAGATTAATEGQSILDNSDAEVLSLFKTQYDDNAAATFNYTQSNVMPLN